jgi:hypothetical protein
VFISHQENVSRTLFGLIRGAKPEQRLALWFSAVLPGDLSDLFVMGISAGRRVAYALADSGSIRSKRETEERELLGKVAGFAAAVVVMRAS